MVSDCCGGSSLACELSLFAQTTFLQFMEVLQVRTFFDFRITGNLNLIIGIDANVPMSPCLDHLRVELAVPRDDDDRNHSSLQRATSLFEWLTDSDLRLVNTFMDDDIGRIDFVISRIVRLFVGTVEVQLLAPHGFDQTLVSCTLGACRRQRIICCVDRRSHCGVAGAARMPIGLRGYRVDSVIDQLPRALQLPLAKATRTQSVEECCPRRRIGRVESGFARRSQGGAHDLDHAVTLPTFFKVLEP